MKELFGLPISTLTICVLVLLGCALFTTLVVAVRDPISFRMGIRNPRLRPLQTGLVVAGLTLGTLIVTAAFATGDTVDHSLTRGAYELLQRSDLDITWTGPRYFDEDSGATQDRGGSYAGGSAVEALETAFAEDGEIAGFLPALLVSVAATDTTSGRSTPSVVIAGFDPARLSRLGGLTLTDGGPADLLHLREGEVFLGRRSAEALQAAAGDTIRLYGPEGARDFMIAGIVRDELASGMLGLEYSSAPGGVAMPLAAARELLGLHGDEISALTVALWGDTRSTVEMASGAAERIQGYLDVHGSELFGGLAGQVEVVTVKQDLVEAGEQSGNMFTSLFLVLGLFSIAAGVLLIFMIFVMLASERRGEMGIARALGAQRGHLVRAFFAESMCISLLAGAIGAPLGVLASLGLTNVLLPATGGDYFSIVEAHVTWHSIAIGYGVGVVITFATSVLASLRVTHVNIVAAIRNLPEPPKREARQEIRWRWIGAGVPAMAVPPLGIWWMLRKGFGLSWTWIVGPAGLVAGTLLMAMGKSSEALFPFALGISLLPVCGGAIAVRLGAGPRGVWTGVGILLLVYWLLPPAQHDALFGTLSGNMEMFVLAGIMIVAGATLVVAHNLALLTRLLERGGTGGSLAAPLMVTAATGVSALAGAVLDASGSEAGQLGFLVAAVLAPAALLTWAAVALPALEPAFKMALAYPVANRFRTGMTIGMFSLTVFSLTVFSVLLANFAVLDGGDAARGNLDIVATQNGAPAAASIGDALRQAGSPEAGAIAAEGRVTVGTGRQEVRLAGAEDWYNHPVIAADSAFFSLLEPSLEFRATGFETDRSVRDAVGRDPGLALIDRYTAGQGFSNIAFDAGIDAVDGSFEPFRVEIRNPATGASATVTVVGVLRAGVPATTVAGVYVNEATYREVFGAPSYQRSYIRLEEGTDGRETAREIEWTLATSGVEAESVAQILSDLNAQNNAFNRMFQAFMALGLLVGIAGLGVIAFRSVVERRQQIGMLRAIGYQRATISLTFLLESTVVALLGITSGVVGGTVLARNLLTSEAFTEGATISLHVPWTEVAAIAFASLAFSVAMGWWPARGAARVPVAEALRYE